MDNLPILSVITFLPLVGAAFILTIRGEAEVVARNARNVAILTSLFTFALSLVIWINFDTSTAEFQFVEQATWMPGYDIGYKMGVDGISVLFVLLSTLLIPICILASWESIVTRVKEYMVAFLVMETMLVGTFCALDLVLFYLFFEGVLIPMFLIIGVWGGPRRVYSAFKFFLYTLTGSVLMLLALIAIFIEAGTTSIPELLRYPLPVDMQTWLWLAFFAAFAVKLPMWPVHTWLPDAHVEAPTAGSVILAGVLLKYGGYGFVRFSLPMMPEASIMFTPLVFSLSVIAVIYTSLVALAQEDMKKLIAYSSVAHMGFVTVGAFSMTTQGLEGAIFQMLSHGIVSAALFLVVGVVYDRVHSRDIDTYGGVVHAMPKYALIFMFFMLASVGLPGTAGFVGEFLVLVGVFQVNAWVAALTATGTILGAAYMLYLYRRVIFGALTKDKLKALLDLSPREIAVFAPLLFLVFWMGLYPQPFLDVMHESVGQLVERLELARAPIETATLTSHERRREPAMPLAEVPDLVPALPELFLAIAAMGLLLAGVVPRDGDVATTTFTSRTIGRLGAICLVIAALLVVTVASHAKGVAFGGMFVIDGYALFFKVIVLLASALCLVISQGYLEAARIDRFEYTVLILLATLGMMMMISANDLISLYVGLEMQSLALYVIAAFNRDDARSVEAGLKYFVLGALASGMLLYGASLVYGFAGSTSFDTLGTLLRGYQDAPVSTGLVVGLVFVIAGLAFKVSAVPFHMWTPDVYEGAPTPVTAFFAVAPKLAAIALLLRVMIEPFGGLVDQWQQVISFIAMASMVLGAFAAIGQTNIKRLMAYSSIGHVGYALIGLSVGTREGIASILVYMVICVVVMTLGTFACILSMRRRGQMAVGIDDLSGLSKTDPVLALALAIFMFSLAGVPPLAGFFGKFYIFLVAVEAQAYTLAIVAALASAVGAFYYLRIVKVMYFDAPADGFDANVGGELRLVIVGTALLTAFFFLLPGPLLTSAASAAATLFAG